MVFIASAVETQQTSFYPYNTACDTDCVSRLKIRVIFYTADRSLKASSDNWQE